MAGPGRTPVVFGSEPLPGWRGACCAIGNFDGVHLGHRELIRALARMARKLSSSPGSGTVAGPGSGSVPAIFPAISPPGSGSVPAVAISPPGSGSVPAVAITFHPHPAEVVSGRSPKRLLPVDDRAKMLLAQGAHGVWVVPFDKELAALEAETFLEQVLVGRLGVRGMVVGPDFRFGAGRRGTVETIERFAREKRLAFEVVRPLHVGAERVSSSAIRQRILAGDVDAAASLLGRHYRIKGRIVHGMRIGSRLGFPTANIDPTDDVLIPKNGIYVVRVRLGDSPGAALPAEGVASVGTRPTFDNGPVKMEVHIFDRQEGGELYGEFATVEFLTRLRDEVKFDTVQALKDQILKDISDARAWFSLRG